MSYLVVAFLAVTAVQQGLWFLPVLALVLWLLWPALMVVAREVRR